MPHFGGGGRNAGDAVGLLDDDTDEALLLVSWLVVGLAAVEGLLDGSDDVIDDGIDDGRLVVVLPIGADVEALADVSEDARLVVIVMIEAEVEGLIDGSDDARLELEPLVAPKAVEAIVVLAGVSVKMTTVPGKPPAGWTIVLVLGNATEEDPVYCRNMVTKSPAGAVVVDELEPGLTNADVVEESVAVGIV